MYIRKIDYFFPSPIRIPAYFILLLGVFSIFINNTTGTIITLFCLLIISGHEGVMIDSKKNRMKFFWSFFFLRFGKWEVLPKFAAVVILPEKTKYIGTSFSLRTTELVESKFGVRLYYPNSNDYILAGKGKLEKIRSDAATLSEIFKVGVEDQSNAKVKW